MWSENSILRGYRCCTTSGWGVVVAINLATKKVVVLLDKGGSLEELSFPAVWGLHAPDAHD